MLVVVEGSMGVVFGGGGGGERVSGEWLHACVFVFFCLCVVLGSDEVCACGCVCVLGTGMGIGNLDGEEAGGGVES